MSKERAMELYVDELKKIIETMSYTDNVAEFMGSVSELDGIDVDDLETVAPEAIKKVKSQPNSPFGNSAFLIFSGFSKIQFILYTTASREASPIRSSERPLRYRNELDYTNSHSHNGHLNTTEPSDDDEYIDTVEVIMIIL